MHFWKTRSGLYWTYNINGRSQSCPSNIKTITKWPKLDNVSKLKGFMGLIGYYQRFVKNYAHKTAPLTDLLKKNSF